MHRCGNCGNKKCVQSRIWMFAQDRACPDWNLKTSRLVIEIVVVFVFMVMLAAVVLGAFGNYWQAQQTPVKVEETKTLEVVGIPPEPGTGGPTAWQMRTGSSTYCVVGAEEEAAWVTRGRVVHVPTAWFQPSLYPELDRVRFQALVDEVVVRSVARVKSTADGQHSWRWDGAKFVPVEAEDIQ